MAVTKLAFSGQNAITINAAEAVAGLPSGYALAPNIQQNVSLGTAAGNASVGGADSQIYLLSTIVGSATLGINVGAATGILGDAVDMVRVKYVRMKLLGSTETAPDGTTTGTACSGISIGGGANPFPLFNSSCTPTLNQHGGVGEALQFESAGTVGQVVSGSNSDIKVTNNDSVNSAIVLTIITGGST